MVFALHRYEEVFFFFSFFFFFFIKIECLSKGIDILLIILLYIIIRAAQRGGKNYKEAKSKQEEIMKLFQQLAREVVGPNYYRYSRSFAGGFEEFV